MINRTEDLQIDKLLSEATNYHRVGDYDRAIEIYRLILSLGPAADSIVTDIHNNLGLALGDQGNHLEAVAQFKQALEFHSTRADVWLNLGAVLQEWRREMNEVLGDTTNLIVNPNYAEDVANQKYARAEISRVDSNRVAIVDYLLKIWRLADLPPEQQRGQNTADSDLDILAEAIACYRYALQLNPTFFQAYGNLGTALCEAGKLQEAADAFQQAIALEPSVAALYFLLGRVCQDLRDFEQAIIHYRQAVRLAPEDVMAWCQLGSAHLCANELTEAEQALAQALSLAPNSAAAAMELAMLKIAQGCYEEAATAALKSVYTSRDIAQPGGPKNRQPQRLSATKLQHDMEQLAYLLKHDRIDRRWLEVLPEYQRLLEALNAQAYKEFDEVVPPASNRFLTAYRGLIHMAPTPAVSGGALNPKLDATDIQARFEASDPAIVYVDDLLKPETADALRKFCLESTIWFNVKDAGDIGTVVNDGFVCPLLFQVAQEIRETFPAILAPYPVSSCWAYKYYEKRSGSNMHADEGAVSVNLWLTPNEANYRTGSGGLNFWNKTCPPEYFQMPRVGKERTLLETINTKDVTLTSIPYGYNRAALFQSNLIHSTDVLDFAPGYENRRINVTITYGRPQK